MLDWRYNNNTNERARGADGSPANQLLEFTYHGRPLGRSLVSMASLGPQAIPSVGVVVGQTRWWWRGGDRLEGEIRLLSLHRLGA